MMQTWLFAEEAKLTLSPNAWCIQIKTHLEKGSVKKILATLAYKREGKRDKSFAGTLHLKVAHGDIKSVPICCYQHHLLTAAADSISNSN